MKTLFERVKPYPLALTVFNGLDEMISENDHQALRNMLINASTEDISQELAQNYDTYPDYHYEFGRLLGVLLAVEGSYIDGLYVDNAKPTLTGQFMIDKITSKAEAFNSNWKDYRPYIEKAITLGEDIEDQLPDDSDLAHEWDESHYLEDWSSQNVLLNILTENGIKHSVTRLPEIC
jgi:hypothetical protein